MTIDLLKSNLKHIKEIIRELYIFTNQLDIIKNLENQNDSFINLREKKLLNDIIISLSNQLKILNNSIPELIKNIRFYKKLEEDSLQKTMQKKIIKPKEKLINIKYSPNYGEKKVSFVINDIDRKEFLKNLSKSNLSINQLKKKYVIKEELNSFGKPNAYAKLSNHFFRNLSNSFVAKGYFKRLNRQLRKMNSPFVIGTYVSMIFFTVFASFIGSIFLLTLLLFFNLSLSFPFIYPLTHETSVLLRFVKVIWIIFAIPILTAFLMYFYPLNEAKNIGSKINQELPFVAIHMSAIASSGVEPISIFKIILRNKEYKYSNTEFRKLMNLINFHGKDLVTALKNVSETSPSSKLKALLDGLATTIISGGSLNEFLDKHAGDLLFDYKLEREKYTKSAETFMDIYISIVIAAPMIFLMLFVIMSSTGTLGNLLGFDINGLSLLIILAIVFLNIGFLIFLNFKQPAM